MIARTGRARAAGWAVFGALALAGPVLAQGLDPSPEAIATAPADLAGVLRGKDAMVF